jgi:hypothetical protein
LTLKKVQAKQIIHLSGVPLTAARELN